MISTNLNKFQRTKIIILKFFYFKNESDLDPRDKLNAEKMNKGEAKSEVYIKYFLAGGSWMSFCLLALMFVTSQLLNSGNDYWMMYWNNAEFIRQKARTINFTRAENETRNEKSASSIFTLDDYGLLSTHSFIYIYAFLMFLVIVTSYTRTFYFFSVVCRASYNLHNEMFSNVLRSTMHFFNTNPSGG